jgi:hypothetical protein
MYDTTFQQAAPKRAVSPSQMNNKPLAGKSGPTRMMASPWLLGLAMTVLFVLMSAHDTFKMSDKMLSGLGLDTAGVTGCSTATGLGVHAVIFYVLAMVVIKISNSMKKVKEGFCGM